MSRPDGRGRLPVEVVGFFDPARPTKSFTQRSTSSRSTISLGLCMYLRGMLITRRDAAAPDHRSGVGASRTALAFDLVGDLCLFGGLHEVVEHEGVDVWPSAEHRPLPEMRLPVLPIVAVGMVGRVADIHHQGNLGIDRVGRADRTPDANLLLRRGHGHDLCGGPAKRRRRAGSVSRRRCRRQPCCRRPLLCRCSRGLPRTRGHRSPHRRSPHARGSPSSTAIRCLSRSRGFPEPSCGRPSVHQVDGALSGDALDRSVLGLDNDAAARDNRPVVASEGGVKIDKATLVHVGDDES